MNQGPSDPTGRGCDPGTEARPLPRVLRTPVCVCLGVKQACCEFLESQLDPSNCLGIRDFAETHNCVDLMRAAEVFSQKHFPEVVQHEEFILLGQGEVEKLIKCDEIQVPPAWCPLSRATKAQHGAAAVLLWQGF